MVISRGPLSWLFTSEVAETNVPMMNQTTLLQYFVYDASCFKACTEEQQGL